MFYTGICREQDGFLPDMIIAGKAIAGGIPCAVYGMSAEVAQRARAAKEAAPPATRVLAQPSQVICSDYGFADDQFDGSCYTCCI